MWYEVQSDFKFEFLISSCEHSVHYVLLAIQILAMWYQPSLQCRLPLFLLASLRAISLGEGFI